MNIRFLSILIFGALLSLTSCEGMLDSIFGNYLDENPDNRLELDSEEKIRKTLVSAYPQASFYYLTELASDNADENTSTAYSAHGVTQEQTYRWEDIIGNDIDTPYDIWQKFYEAIQTACAAIDALDDLRSKGKISDENLANGIEAEARLCRAYGHFILVNLFSKSYDEATAGSDLGIPYIEKAETNLLVKHERGTVKGVYEKIEKDILMALPNVAHIKVSSTGSSGGGLLKYHWNRESANAFAARFFLYYKKYDQSIKYATVALGDNPAAKLRNWAADGRHVTNTSLAHNNYIDPTQTANFLLVPAESLWGRVVGMYYYGKKFALQGVTYNEIAPDVQLPIGGRLYYRCVTALQGAIAVTPKVGEYFEYYDKVAGIGWTHIVQALFTADKTLLTRAEAYALSGNNSLDMATKDLDEFLRCFTDYTRKSYTESAAALIAFMRQPDPGDETKTSIHDYDPRTTAKNKFKKPINLGGLTEDQKDVLQGILLAKRALTLHEGTRWFDINRYKIEIYNRKIYDGTPIPNDRLTVDDPRRVFQIPQQMVSAGMQPNPRP